MLVLPGILTRLGEKKLASTVRTVLNILLVHACMRCDEGELVHHCRNAPSSPFADHASILTIEGRLGRGNMAPDGRSVSARVDSGTLDVRSPCGCVMHGDGPGQGVSH